MRLKIYTKRFLKLILGDNLYFYLVSTYVNLFQIKYLFKKILFRYYHLISDRYPGFLYPEVLMIFLTTRCNLRCFICRRENFFGQDLDFENIYTLEKAIKNASVIDLTGWGEALLYPKFREVVEYICSVTGKKRVLQIITNGTLLSKDVGKLLRGRLHYFKISLNAAFAETYNRDMKYGDFDSTVCLIQEFMDELDEKDRSIMRMHFVAHTGNFREIPAYVELAHKLGIRTVDIGQYMAGIVEHENYTLFNVKEEYNQVIEEAESLSVKLGVYLGAPRFFTNTPIAYTKCIEPYKVCIIGVDGKVSPCCFAGSYSPGNVYESGFEAIWFSAEYQRLRKHRYLNACQKCNPYIPLDNLSAHYDPAYKEKNDAK